MKAAYTLSGLVAVVMLAQSALGLLFRHQYRDVEWITATWLGNDWVTLIVGLPLLSAGIVMSQRGSVRGLLLWLGTLGYAIYNSAYYLLGATFNVFFPLLLGGSYPGGGRADPGALYLIVLTINSSIAVARGFTPAPGEMPLWGGLAATTTAATLLLLRDADGRVET